MVRLKVVDNTYKQTQIVFQFHYGTIKSTREDLSEYPLHLFQFHYGTIKS